jgi:hypothetical protein
MLSCQPTSSEALLALRVCRVDNWVTDISIGLCAVKAHANVPEPRNLVGLEAHGVPTMWLPQTSTPEGSRPENGDDTWQALTPAPWWWSVEVDSMRASNLVHRSARSRASSWGLTRSLSWDLAGYWGYHCPVVPTDLNSTDIKQIISLTKMNLNLDCVGNKLC